MEDQNKKQRFKKYQLVVLIGGLSALTVFFLMHGKKMAAEPKPLPPMVKSYEIESEYASSSRYTGTVHARIESDLGFRVGGKIIERLVDEGQHVSKGQTLLRVDVNDLVLAHKAALQDVIAAKAERDRALPDLKRLQDLFALRAASEQEFQRALATADASIAKLHAAEAQANITNNELQYATLKADSDGVITDIPAEIGQVISAGQIVVRLAKDGAREAVINLPEQKITQAKSASEAYLYTNPGSTFPVKLRELSAMADKTSRTYQTRYTLLGEGLKAPLGSTVTVIYKINDLGSAKTFSVPLGALYNVGEQTNVWIIKKDSTVNLLPVQVMSLGQETAGVKAEFKQGEKIVALGAHLLKPGQQVRIAQDIESEDIK